MSNKQSFRSRLLIVMAIYSLIQLSIVALLSYWYVSQQEYEDKGQRALDVARVVAKLPGVIDGVAQQDSPALQAVAEELRKAMGASFIVIGDKQGIRLAHPRQDRIGKKMVGGDNYAALNLGNEYVSTARGSLGYSVRGKVPIRTESGEIIGIVSVGYLLEAIDQQLEPYLIFMAVLVVGVLSLNMVIGAWLAQRIKDALLGYEPEQMTRLYAEQQATLNSIREGLITINRAGVITNINANALQILDLEGKAQQSPPVGQQIASWLPDSDLVELLDHPEVQSDVELLLNGHNVIANRRPIFDNHERFIGMVSSFRRKDEITELSQQLSQVKAHSEALRVQNHEHANQLNTIAGLIQLGEGQKALELIGQESTSVQELIQFLLETVPDPVVSACLLGKYHRAKELGIELFIDPDSSMGTLPQHIAPEQVVTIISNLIDNAFEASLKATAKHPVNISMTALGKDLVIEVEDGGVGIAPELAERIFEQGVSSKPQQGHGIGLHLVRQTAQLLRGYVEYACEEGSTRFTVYLPKNAPSPAAKAPIQEQEAQ